MKNLILLSSLLLCFHVTTWSQAITLPEHPRPDFERSDWQNLNGEWSFAFDANDEGVQSGWVENGPFNQKINVPFPWGSKLSGVADEADIGWYQRRITVDETWKGKRTFLTIGASDWETMVWLDDELLGTHQGGYVPFSFELTDYLDSGKPQQLTIRVDDKRRDFTLYGKQGYGNARGIWQTIYLEARGTNYLDALHFSPDIDAEKVGVVAYLGEPASKDMTLNLAIQTEDSPINQQVEIAAGEALVKFEVAIPSPRLWTLDDPYLYEVEATLDNEKVKSYFGMRKISVENLPGTDYPYIALNDQPVYMQLALDQSYHPDGYYTFPSDAFMKEEILRSKSIGLNGIRPHIKVEIPRKLYWADKLGLLVMQDLPNSWGEPDAKMKAESEYTLREMIKRDYNHPAIFSWIVFNETWGLFTKVGEAEDGKPIRSYLPETQDWVASMYYLAKSLDQTRLVEDNSICCGVGHTETDINSWHAYLPGWAWNKHLKEISEKTFDGSTHHFEEGFEQDKQPNINSECGNVWGYQGSTGDVDWSWDYHRMMNSFRMYPKIAGWLYTEHHDVINEWNGYWRFDRSEKETGLGELMEGMSINDFHSPVYLSMGNEISKTVKGGSTVEIPMHLSVMTGEKMGAALTIRYELAHTNQIGATTTTITGELKTPYQPWMQKTLEPLSLTTPTTSGVATLKVKVSDADGEVLHHNIMHLIVEADEAPEGVQMMSVAANKLANAEWTEKQWDVMDGKKVNGAGKGYFEYEIPMPANIRTGRIQAAYFLVEAAAKELFVKDQVEFDNDQDYMKGSRVYPSSNPNAYPMSDETMFPSEINVSVNGRKVQTTTLADDPADHRGILSWHHQLKDRKLREAGSYGYLVKVPISKRMLRQSVRNGKLTVRLATTEATGIAIYGKDFGRYMVDPSIVLVEK